jgi:hypothetical protein
MPRRSHPAHLARVRGACDDWWRVNSTARHYSGRHVCRKIDGAPPDDELIIGAAAEAATKSIMLGPNALLRKGYDCFVPGGSDDCDPKAHERADDSRPRH